MLEDFLSSNRAMLIARCRSKVATRRAPRATDQELWYGIPLFLDQLVNALQRGKAAPPSAIENTSSSSAIGRMGAQHGNELLRRGFTVGEVVSDYGDLCQAITDVAIEQNATISAAEFRTLNRCLDDAIAGAVTELWRQHGEFTSADCTRATNERLGCLAHELRNLIGTANPCRGDDQKRQRGAGGGHGRPPRSQLDRTA
jgi:hypothetical protein